jgi:hypothetical protein
MSRTPFVWPVINIPQPFGNTPLFAKWQKEGRLLTTMPFYFYQMPYLVTRPKHYDPIEYYDKVIELQTYATSWSLLRRRLACTQRWDVQLMSITRTINIRRALSFFCKTLDRWRHDRHVLAFHRGDSRALPEVYEQILRRSLGAVSSLLTRSDLTPVLPSPDSV